MLKTGIQINDMGHGNNGAAEHVLLDRGGNAHAVHSAFQAKAEIEDILQFRADIVIGDRVGIDGFLPCKQG